MSGYPAILAALVTRLQGACSGNVQPCILDPEGGLDSSEFQDAFLDLNSKLNSWQVDKKQEHSEKTLDDDSSYLVKHSLTLQFMWAFEHPPCDRAAFDSQLSLAREDLRTGDRTLGGAAYSYSDPTAPRIGEFFFGSVFCRGAFLSLDVAEVLTSKLAAP